MQDAHTGLKNVKYLKPVLCGRYEKFDIPKFEEIYRPTQSEHPFYTYHDKPFSKERYQYSCLPIHTGPFQITLPSTPITNVLRCPIKNANSRSIYLPEELGFLKDYVMYCNIYENSFNPRYEELFSHITVDYKHLEPGDYHRVKGFHVDGFQGHKFPVKHEIEHSYLWSSNNFMGTSNSNSDVNNIMGTEFCVQPFFLSHIDDSKYLIFNEMEKQANPDNIYQCLNNNVYIFDPYMVHRTPVAKEPSNRLLVRITFEYQKLLDPNDTLSPEPSLQFKIPYKYDIRNRLGDYTIDLNHHMFGFHKV